ncbi:MAG: hypothetical protein S4CHLAM20_11130 [Chlamydiia bacterium]|nr:hypothetical protein [Chlamydiia bacterium]
MAICNRLYFCGSQPIDSHSKVVFKEANNSKCARFTRWVKWGVQLPIVIPHMIYSIFMMMKHKELIAPLRANLLEGRFVHRVVLTPTKSQYVITSAKIANQMFKSYRNDQNGLFGFDEKGNVSLLFLSVLQDIVNEPVNLNDFLFTCDPAQVECFREPMLNFLGPKNMPSIRAKLDDVNQDMLGYLFGLEEYGRIQVSAKDLCGMYAVSVISYILLGKRASDFQEYRNISNAIHECMTYSVSKLWKKPEKEQTHKYNRKIEVLRGVIENSQGNFLDLLKNISEISEIQRKGIFFLLYIGGGETAASLLEFIFWQLGKRSDLQTRIVKEIETSNRSETLNKVVIEGLRLNSPTLISRTPNKDVEMTVNNKTGKSWKYTFNKGEDILYAPYFTTRNQSALKDYEEFNPDRRDLPKQIRSLPWLPFSLGKHGCPGKFLGLAEIKSMLSAILMNFEIVSGPQNLPKQKQILTLHLDSDVTLNLTRRT